ncbi:hypothetical protein N7470_004026 [Penicillium chermesinum]|nr:hypothetical protein N7470_004026 [Penicillium chermesinum]
MSDVSFEPNAIVRGFQFDHSIRALRNPELFKHEHFRQAAIAVAVGVVIHLIVQIPIIILKFALYIMSFIVNLHEANWDDKLLHGLGFISQSVLQIPFVLMTLMGHLTPTLDEIFMQSIHWVDTTYIQKHKSDNPDTLRAMYYPNLALFPTKDGTRNSQPKYQVIIGFVNRYGKKLALGSWGLLPLHAPCFWSFCDASSQLLHIQKKCRYCSSRCNFWSRPSSPEDFNHQIPSHLLRIKKSDERARKFGGSHFGPPALFANVFFQLDPYFRRIKFTPEQKRRWFHDREGVLFGFAFAFTVALKTPFIGVLMYGVAEASTAYLVTKITDPPPLSCRKCKLCGEPSGLEKQT